MKIYDYTQAPNPRRLRIFLAEKGVAIPYEQVDIATAKNRAPEFLKINPLGGLPVLELDDGTHLAESVAICRYFESINPQPPLMGTDTKDKALVEMWQRRMEIELFGMMTAAFRNSSPFFKGRIPQVAEWAAVCKNAAGKRMDWLDGELANRPYVAGDRFTIADITALVAIDFGKLSDIRIKPEQKNLARWYELVSSRPSAKA